MHKFAIPLLALLFGFAASCATQSASPPSASRTPSSATNPAPPMHPASLSATEPAAPAPPQSLLLLLTLDAHSGYIRSLAFSPDGQTLASTGDDNLIRLWNLHSGKLSTTLQGHTDKVHALAFSPDGKTLASASDDHTVRLWNLATAKTIAILVGHTDKVWAVAFSPDGKTLASASWDQSIKFWNLPTFKNIATLNTKLSWYLTSIAFSPDGQSLASGTGGGSIQLWNLQSAQCTTLCNDESEYVEPVVIFSPDGKTLASAAQWNPRKAVLLWDPSTGKLARSLPAHGLCGVAALAYLPGGKTLLSVGYNDGNIMLWNPVTGQNTATFHQRLPLSNGYSITCGALGSDGTTLALATSEKKIELWRFSPNPTATPPVIPSATQPGPFLPVKPTDPSDGP